MPSSLGGGEVRASEHPSLRVVNLSTHTLYGPPAASMSQNAIDHTTSEQGLARQLRKKSFWGLVPKTCH